MAVLDCEDGGLLSTVVSDFAMRNSINKYKRQRERVVGREDTT